MKIPHLLPLAAFVLCGARLAAVDLFTIADFTFQQENSVTTAAIVEGPENLDDFSNRYFGRLSESYIRTAATGRNEFAQFNRGNSIARLMGRGGSGDLARHITFPHMKGGPPPNRDRVVLELTWGDRGLRNRPGPDFVVFESAVFEGVGVAVRKAGDTQFSDYRYRFSDGEDTLHNVQAISFNLSDFGLAEGELITAIRIVNIFNSGASEGADRVDHPSGQGKLLRAGDPGYENGHPLLDEPDGKEFSVDRLNADIIYVVGLHDVEPVR